MTDWYPPALRRAIASKVRSRGSSKPNAFVLHIAVSESNSLQSLFSNPKYGCSHFYLRRDGILEQYLPISSKSMADVEGNHRAVSVETQGGLKQEPWTDRQVETLSQLAAWLNVTHGIPLRLMENSRPETAGLAGHRWGIDGNFPDSGLFAGRTQRGGGEKWSNSRGKTCPDNQAAPSGDVSRIAQIPGILARALVIAGAVSNPVEKPTTPPIVKPTPIKKEVTVRATLSKINLSNADRTSVRGNADMERLQGLLLAQGYGPGGLVGSNGRPDGIGGSATKRYVGQFQVRHNTGDGKGHADYIVGEGTWTALLEK